MKLLKADKGRFHFLLEEHEKLALFQVLTLYPLTPAKHYRISKSEDRPDDQELLEDAQADQRRRHKRQVAALLKSKNVFTETEQGFQVSLKASQLEWLLQVLNDVRIGAWVVLGSPDGPKETLAAVNEQNAGYFWVMEAVGFFLMSFIGALNHGRNNPATG